MRNANAPRQAYGPVGATARAVARRWRAAGARRPSRIGLVPCRRRGIIGVPTGMDHWDRDAASGGAGTGGERVQGEHTGSPGSRSVTTLPPAGHPRRSAPRKASGRWGAIAPRAARYAPTIDARMDVRRNPQNGPPRRGDRTGLAPNAAKVLEHPKADTGRGLKKQ
ncbi:hypothetical protein GCM10020254_78710 [Streptomyces goshikiensis]